MKFPSLFSSAVLLGAVSVSLTGVSRCPGQTAIKPKASARPVTATLPITSDTGNSSTSAATDPVGFTTANLPANSDSLISIPLTRPAEFSGTLSSVSGNTLTVAAAPNWTSNQFVYVQGTQPKKYYAIIGANFQTVTGTVTATNGSATVTGSGTAFTTQVSAGDEIVINGNVAQVASVPNATSLTLVSAFVGTTAAGASATYDHSPKEGSYYTVTANGSNTVTVDLNGDSLSSIAATLGNTTVTLIPYWTLATAFPATDSGVSFTPSPSSKVRGTQVLLPDNVTAGVNLTPASAYYFLSGHWVSVTDSANSYDDTILPPTSLFTVRNAATATTFTPAGSVYMNRVSVPLDTQASVAQDNAVAIPRPAAFTLNDSGLVSSGAFAVSQSTKSRADLLLVYDNTATGYNKTPVNTYYYYNNGWRLVSGDSSVDYGATVTIPYGAGLVIRKAATNTGATAFWQNGRNY